MGHLLIYLRIDINNRHILLKLQLNQNNSIIIWNIYFHDINILYLEMNIRV